MDEQRQTGNVTANVGGVGVDTSQTKERKDSSENNKLDDAIKLFMRHGTNRNFL